MKEELHGAAVFYQAARITLGLESVFPDFFEKAVLNRKCAAP